MLGPIDIRRKRAAGRTEPPAPSRLADLAARPALREALASFARDRRWIDEQHVQICRIPAPTFREEKRAYWMVDQLKALGWDARMDRAGNVSALPGPDRGQPLVALTAHLDTVLAPQAAEDVKFEPDGRLLGPGVSDNGAGLAALVAVARAATTYGLWDGATVSPVLVANVCEEGEGNLNGMRFLCRQSPLAGRIRAFIVLDGPNTDHVTAEALACRRFEVAVNGPGGHSWSDYGTANPVHALSRVVADFTNAIWETPPSTVRSSFNFGWIEGGSTINAIPTFARAKVDLRSEDAVRLDELAELLARTVEAGVANENDHATSGRISSRVRETGSRPGGRLAPDSPLLKLFRDVDGMLGIQAHLDCASTDANIPLSIGLPAVSIGAGGQGGGAHTPSEWYSPVGRDLGLRRILLALTALIEDPPPESPAPGK
jgi:tripeptide aminopeptidase